MINNDETQANRAARLSGDEPMLQQQEVTDSELNNGGNWEEGQFTKDGGGL